MNAMIRRRFLGAACSLLGAMAMAFALVGCANDHAADTTVVTENAPMLGLASAALILDDPAHRAVVLTSPGADALSIGSLPIGHGLVSANVSPDGKRAFVLAAGDQPRTSERDERASLTVIDASAGASSAPTASRYTLASPLSGMSIDPAGRWLALYAGASGSAFVENPNALVLIDLSAPPSATNPIVRNIRSFGGRPERLTFTGTLQLPGGPRRLLVVETAQDVTLLDLDHLEDATPRPEITVRLDDGTGTGSVTPAGVVIDDGDPKRTDDTRIAVRLADDSNVVTLQLTPAPSGTTAPAGMVANDFTPEINLTDVGGIATDLAFVHTDGGLRIGALVPSRKAAVLVEPDTSVTETVALPAAYSRLVLVTDGVLGASSNGVVGGDVALLWNGGASSGVAFWSLGTTAGAPYRSLETLPLPGISTVTPVPAPNATLEVLSTGDGRLFVLDLAQKTAAPILTEAGYALRTTISSDAARLWAFSPGSADLGMVSLPALAPYPIVVEQPVDAVFDVARADGGRALLAMHARGSYGVTVLDASHPDASTYRLFSSLLLEGQP
jgi:hypothetical protein